METLLELGADPDIPANGNITPAHRACSWAHEEIVMLLIEFSADLDARDDAGRTPWDVLCQVQQAPESDKLGRAHATDAMRVRLQTWAKWLLDPVSNSATLTALLRQPAAKHIQSVYEERMPAFTTSAMRDIFGRSPSDCSHVLAFRSIGANKEITKASHRINVLCRKKNLYYLPIWTRCRCGL